MVKARTGADRERISTRFRLLEKPVFKRGQDQRGGQRIQGQWLEIAGALVNDYQRLQQFTCTFGVGGCPTVRVSGIKAALLP